MAETKSCTKNCGRNLGPNNASGVCTPCQRGGAAGEVRAERKAKAPKSEVLKRFRTVAEAIGEDPDELIEGFAEGYLGRVKESVRRSVVDEL